MITIKFILYFATGISIVSTFHYTQSITTIQYTCRKDFFNNIRKKENERKNNN